MLKAEVIASIDGLSADDGAPLALVLCNGNLSLAEIAAGLQADGPINRDDRDATELAERFCKIVGYFMHTTPTQGVFVGNEGGPLIVTKPRWTFSNDSGWQWIVWNAGTSAMVTGASLRFAATHFGVWVT